ncbi:MAG: 3-methyl-2-oxobutanoate dehydrogenase subunit VorB [Armatimonadota bacterium]|nr:3-methyl-2-oxobutanoate dehydrogenase subunit VorB [Armatimonadota bacterium]MDR7486475.1 3-methyl-2-oxobutanoate dehydrogenase subunit VorB [Armatimonadota bacterium]MDR7532241.1 3-methyl-2-oxobutanoate dehydrogenase subunit VorB [Armatimonadota bacterium]MDR7537184.1 3-methyl-2-oxobutanoate dehydrogenase subunit VorB [Armatimonadota bacterium]
MAAAPRVLMKGNEAMAEAAIRAGCRAYFAYPITPQTELAEYMAAHLPRAGGVFLQAESEVAAINMVYGASGTGARVMTSTSSPGFSLMLEGLSYLVGARLPCVVVNVMRGGPGLGNIAPAQSDYFEMTRALGHGDSHGIVLAPATVQEAVDLVRLAFELAERYRLPALIAADGLLGQMMEPVTLPDPVAAPQPPAWATTGGGRRLISSIYLQPEDLERHVRALAATYQAIARDEPRWAVHALDDAEVAVVAYGTLARIARAAVDRARAEGIRTGLLRPVTLWPFPAAAFARPVKHWLVVELNAGQMVEDVRLAVGGRTPVTWYGRLGGVVPAPAELVEVIHTTVRDAEGVSA